VKRFWDKVDVLGPDDCWEWLAYTDVGGYGKFKFNGNDIRAHRFSWMLCNGEIPEGMFVLHHCDNPPCVNHHHLFLGSAADNSADMVRKGRAPNGVKSGIAKLNDIQVLAIRKLYPAVNQTQLGSIFGVTQANIGYILARKTWKHI